MGTTFSSLLCIPDSWPMGQSVKVRTKQQLGSPRQGLPRDGLRHSGKKCTLACSAFAVPSEPRVVCCCQCLQGAAAGPAAWAGHLYLPLPHPSIGCLFEEAGPGLAGPGHQGTPEQLFLPPSCRRWNMLPSSTCHPECSTAALNS